MPIFKTFSQRQREAASTGQEDVYQYTEASAPLRNQLVMIANDALGSAYRYQHELKENPHWRRIEQTFCRESGLLKLANAEFAAGRLANYMRTCSIVDLIDLLEIVCQIIGMTVKDSFHYLFSPRQKADEAINEINYRLRQAALGFQFEDSQIVRIDSQYLHAEAVKPALSLVSRSGYEGPRAEFLAAHEAFRRGDHKQAIIEAGKAFESMMKAVADKKGWAYAKGARASDLLKVLQTNGLWPDYLDKSFDQLLATLKSGLPEVRNSEAAHGQGAATRDVPSYVAAYALHLAAAKIVLLGQAAEA